MHCSRFALFFDPVYFSSLHSKKSFCMRKYRISEICSGTRERRQSFLSLSSFHPFFSLYICNKGYKRRQLYDWLNSQCVFIFMSWYCLNFKKDICHLYVISLHSLRLSSSCILVIFDRFCHQNFKLLVFFQKFRIDI